MDIYFLADQPGPAPLAPRALLKRVEIGRESVLGNDPLIFGTRSQLQRLKRKPGQEFRSRLPVSGLLYVSKSLDDNSQTIAGDTFANGINSPKWWLPKAYYGPSDFNVAHTLTINALYTIPTPKSWSGAMKEALADWEVGGIYTFNSGTPTTVTNPGIPWV